MGSEKAPVALELRGSLGHWPTLPSLPNQRLPLRIEEHQASHIIAGTGLQDGAVGVGLPADRKHQLITPEAKGCTLKQTPRVQDLSPALG